MTDVHTVIKSLMERGWQGPTYQDDGTFELVAVTPYWIETDDDDEKVPFLAMINLDPRTETMTLFNEVGVSSLPFDALEEEV